MRPDEDVPLRVDPLELSRLAASTLDVAAALADGWRSSAPLLTPRNGAEQVHRAAARACAAAETALRRVAEVFAA
ncbi:MAG: hypothetical protein HOV79_20205, partial [Hamadaea sp.]|nr:hypothetical protein [Hamadaea sp.]